MTLLLIGFSLGMLSCWLMNRVPRDRDLDWRRSFNHENTNRPSGPPPYGWGARQLSPPPPPPAGWVRGPYGYRPPGDPSLTVFTEGEVQRGNGNGGPSTGKPVAQAQPAGNAVRPPLGLTPRFIADEARLREVADAINRLREAGWRVPFEWLVEYHELCRKVEAVGVFNAPAIRAAAADEKPQPYGNPNPPPSAP
jgi:hypothetical protein